MMKYLVKIYEENSPMLEGFITSTLLRFNNKTLSKTDIQSMFKLFPSLELFYRTDNNLIQTSPNIGRDLDEDEQHLGARREYLLYNKKSLKKKEFSEEKDVIVKPPYISSVTGNLCITVIQNREDDYLFLDFQLEKLLKRFGLYSNHKQFESMLQFFYGMVSLSLIGVAFFLSGYGVYLFLDNLLDPSISSTFKPVIALTLGLAIFDLGKTIFEQEILSSEYDRETFKPKTLINFTVSIIIALMIESLLIVFKISITNYHDLIYSLYLLIGTSILFLAFTIFYFLYKKSKKS